MINKSVLRFHETFKPEIGYVSKILKLASEHYTGTKASISDISGIPTGEMKGKVEPHIKYASFMGLIDYSYAEGSYSLSPTPLGEVVISEDPYLHEELSLWLCHYCMCRKIAGAPQWSFLIHDAHPGFGNQLNQDRLFDLAEAWCNTPKQNMLKDVFSVVKGSYVDGCFARLNFLDWNDAIEFYEQREKMYLIYVYAYALFDSWERVFPDKKEITDFELKDELGFNKIFGFNEEECGYVIDSLSDEGLLSVNRQLFPATIIRTANSDKVISLLYSRLL